MASEAREGLLTSSEVADLLRVHRKQVYRLMKQGLPAHRLGGEWRFVRAEVLAWAERGGAAPPPPLGEEATPVHRGTSGASPPPLLAANGDVVVEDLLAGLEAAG